MLPALSHSPLPKQQLLLPLRCTYQLHLAVEIAVPAPGQPGVQRGHRDDRIKDSWVRQRAVTWAMGGQRGVVDVGCGMWGVEVMDVGLMHAVGLHIAHAVGIC